MTLKIALPELQIQEDHRHDRIASNKDKDWDWLIAHKGKLAEGLMVAAKEVWVTAWNDDTIGDALARFIMLIER